MSIDAAIPLQVQTPQQPQNALAGLAQIAQIKSASLQNALVTQEISQRAVQAQQAQYAQSVMQATNAAISKNINPQTGEFDLKTAKQQLASAGYGQAALSLDEIATKHGEDVANLQTKQLGLAADKAKVVSNILQGATDQHSWSTGLGVISATPGLGPDVIEKAGIPTVYDPAAQQSIVNRGVGISQAIENRLKDQQTKNAAAQLPGITAESDIKTTQANAIKNFNPVQMQQQINQQVDSELNPANYPDPTIQRQVRIENANAKTSALQAARDAVAAGKPPGDAAQAAIKDSVDRVGRTYQGVATAAATVPSKVTVLQAGNNIQQQAKAKQEYAESLNNVQDIQSTAQTIKNLVEQAKAGNSTASGQLKTMLAEMTNSVQGIKRLAGGQTEQSLGSAADRLQGFIADIGSGQKVPDRVLQELPGVIDTLAATSTRAHNAHVDTTNGLYQTTFPKLPENSSTAATSGGALPQGKGQVIDTQTAQKYFDAAGGDKAKARQLAIQNGWKLQ